MTVGELGLALEPGIEAGVIEDNNRFEIFLSDGKNIFHVADVSQGEDENGRPIIVLTQERLQKPMPIPSGLHGLENW